MRRSTLPLCRGPVACQADFHRQVQHFPLDPPGVPVGSCQPALLTGVIAPVLLRPHGSQHHDTAGSALKETGQHGGGHPVGTQIVLKIVQPQNSMSATLCHLNGWGERCPGHGAYEGMPGETGPSNLICQTSLPGSRFAHNEHEATPFQRLPQQRIGIAFHVGRCRAMSMLAVCRMNTSQFGTVHLADPGNASRRRSQQRRDTPLGMLRPQMVRNKGVYGRDGRADTGGQRTGRPGSSERQRAGADSHGRRIPQPAPGPAALVPKIR